jgi:cellulose synthase/poly-beta-1,6-N-acetylglucosamine synthase-like glycosyltransferase
MFIRGLRVKLINSAFGPLLKPNVCVLLDVGTKPTGTSIYEVSYLMRRVS